MTSIRARLAVFSGALFAGSLAVLLLAGSFLIEPWFAWRSYAPFSKVRLELDGAAPDIGALTRRVKALAEGTTFKISVIDRDGSVVASSAPEFSAGQRLALPREELEFFQARLRELEGGATYYGVLPAQPPGHRAVHLVARIGPGLFIVVYQPLDQLRQAMSAASSFFIVFGIAILALELCALLAASRRALVPLLDISGIARRISGGDLEARWHGKRDDEIGSLGSDLNAMADRLVATIGELERKMKAQEDFLAGAAHELKTPIGLVRGYAEALSLGYWSSDAERDELASVIMKEADRLDRLVRDLSFAAIGSEAGASLLRADEDIVPIAKGAAERFAREAEGKGVGIAFEPAPDGPIVASFDALRLTQALDNLLSNALRHAPEGGYVRVTARRRGEAAVISVENSGERVPEEALPRLFEPFYRVDSSRNRESGGSGLGLAFVKRVAEAHGGSCGIENTAAGVRAWISLPAPGAGREPS